MDTKRDIENKARSLIESSPEESVVLYEKIWNEYNKSPSNQHYLDFYPNNRYNSARCYKKLPIFL